MHNSSDAIEVGSGLPELMRPTCRGSPRARCALRLRYFATSSDRIRASVHVMSTRSPTFTLDSASLSFTRVLYFQSCGPVNVIDGRFGSIARIVGKMGR